MRVALFIDGAAMFYAQREMGWHIDFKKVYDHFIEGKKLSGAFYFTATPPGYDKEAVSNYRRFKTFLVFTGYMVVDKEVKVIEDEKTQDIKLKGNLDIELVFRMLTSAHGYDEAVLLGGDSDYVPVIEHLRNTGKVIHCIGRREATSLELMNVCNRYTELETLRSTIQRD